MKMITNNVKNVHGDVLHAKETLKTVFHVSSTDYHQSVIVQKTPSVMIQTNYAQNAAGHAKIVSSIKLNVLSAEETESIHQPVNVLLEHMNRT